MAWGKKRTATFHDKEILKYLTGLEAIKNVVLDSTQVTVGADARYVLEAGTVLVTGAGGLVKPAPASGVLAADVIGILTHTIEFFYPVEAGVTDEPAAAYFHECVFDSSKLIGYSGNAAAIKAALPTCLFQ
jgi:hypothetical protein